MERELLRILMEQKRREIEREKKREMEHLLGSLVEERETDRQRETQRQRQRERETGSEHALTLMEGAPYSKGQYQCNLCYISGNGPVYHCSACQYDLHPTCITTSPKGTHFLHAEHPLIRRSIGEKRSVSCDGCNCMVRSDCYNCQECNFDLHPACARAPKYAKHPAHSHVLKLTAKPQVKVEGGMSVLDVCQALSCSCVACGDELTSLAYRCKTCPNFGLHMACMQLPTNPLLPSLHTAHRLALHFQSPYRNGSVSCNKCKEQVNEWVYHCKDCKYDLHIRCACIPHHTSFMPSLSSSSSSSQDPNTGSRSSSSVGTRPKLHSIIGDIIQSRHKK